MITDRRGRRKCALRFEGRERLEDECELAPEVGRRTAEGEPTGARRRAALAALERARRELEKRKAKEEREACRAPGAIQFGPTPLNTSAGTDGRDHQVLREKLKYQRLQDEQAKTAIQSCYKQTQNMLSLLEKNSDEHKQVAKIVCDFVCANGEAMLLQ